MALLNSTDIIGLILIEGSKSTTGNMYVTLFVVLLFLIAIALMFGIPLEFTAIIILPFIMVAATYYGEFLPLVIMILFYFTFFFIKRFFVR